jgi:hypothetical protein
MREQIEARLATLKSEHEKGQAQFRQLEVQVTSVRETLLRISGAMLVLEEILSSPTSLEIVDQSPAADANNGSKSAASAA